MSDASRKRSRKSKLVLRTCMEVEDEDHNVTNLQTTPNAWPGSPRILPKTNPILLPNKLTKKQNAMLSKEPSLLQNASLPPQSGTDARNILRKDANINKKAVPPKEVSSKPAAKPTNQIKETKNNHTTLSETSDDFEALIDNARDTASQREFSITVAVEEFDENSTDLVIDEEYEQAEIKLAKQDEVESPVTVSQDEIVAQAVPSNSNENSFIEVYTHTIKPNSPEPQQIIQPYGNVESKFFEVPANDLAKMYILDREHVLEATRQILKESINIPDRVLAIEVRNCMGHYPVAKRDKFEEKIQRVFDQWLDWQKVLMPKFRSSPLFYKCYICQLSWWHLWDFRMHLKQHPDCRLDLEEYSLYEANVIAYRRVNDIREIQQFNTKGRCPKCEKEYAVHKTENRLQDGNYICKVPHCIRAFLTCFLLRSHEVTAHSASELLGGTLPAKQWKKTCEVCGIVCYTQLGYRTHMYLLHSVRSDLVVALQSKRCQSCHAKYSYSTAHICVNKGTSIQCQCCFRIFPLGLWYNTHKNKTQATNCKFCKQDLPVSCMEIEHMFMHTHKFMMVKRCILCPNFAVFLDSKAATHHEFTKHSKGINYDMTFGSPLKFFDTIIIPKSCLVNSRKVVEGVPHVTIKEEPVTDASAPESPIKQDMNEVFDTTGDEEDTEEEIPVTIKTDDVQDNEIDDENVNHANDDIDHATDNKSNADENEIHASDEINANNTQDESNADDNITVKEELIIKEELDYEDNFDSRNMMAQYSIKIEQPDSHSSIFGIKIEPGVIINQANQEEESEYEDDIIRLDYVQEDSENHGQVLHGAVEVEIEDVLQESMDIDSRESIEYDARDHQSTQRIPNIYRCNKCGFEGIHKDYRAHITGDNECSRMNQSKVPNLYRCNICGFEGPHKEYKNHLALECGVTDDKGCYKCTKCNLTYKTFKKYVEHFFLHGLTSKSCPVCFKVYDGYTALLSHISMHIRMKYVSVRLITLEGHAAGFNFQCKTCKQYVNKPDFFPHWEQHLTIVDRDEREVQEAQDKREAEKTNLTRPIDEILVQKLLDHLQSLESSDRLRPGCIICHKYFSRKNDCKRHMIEHLLNDAYAHRPLYHALRCQICSKDYQKPDNYKKHMRDHGSLPVYKCEICDKTFSDSSNFTKHRKLHNVNAFTCDICGKKFQAKHSIVKHMAVHETEKPIICPLCNKVFYSETALRRHHRNRHDFSPKFGCTICGVRFNTSREKWDHKWLVHRERKYQADCKLCNMSFRRFLDLKHHQKAEHNLAVMKSTKLEIPAAPSSSKSIYEILKTTKIVGIKQSEETLVVYE